MSKVRVKVKAVKDKELAEMFNQMLGAGDTVNINICYPRYIQLRGYVEKVLQVLDIFNNKCKFYESFQELLPCQKEINDYIERTRSQLAKDYFIDLSAYEWNLSMLSEEQVKEFSKVYDNFKKSETLSVLVAVCDNLIQYKKYIGDEKNLSHKFILTMAGAEFCPFPFTRLNFKYVLNMVAVDNASNNTVTPITDLLLSVLNKILNITHNLYRVLSTPDIDIDEFVNVVMRNIEEAKKRPEMSRCRRAFDKLTKSVEMLKENFSTYYRDFIESNNSTIIIENFVLDVAKNTKADPQLMREFRTIINYYKKIAASQVKNPQVQGLLNKINEQFAKFDKFTNINRKNEVEIEPSDSSSDDTPDDDEKDSTEELRKIQEENAKKSVDELVAEINAGDSKPRRGKKH